MQWYWWALAAIALAGAELLSGQLVLIMVAVGAAVGAFVSLIAPHALLLQVLVASLVAVLMLFAVRPLAVKHIKLSTANLRTGVDRVKGSKGVVLEKVDARDGRVKVNGEIWSARAYDPYTTIDVGGDIRVVEIDGATAVVLPTEL